MLLASQMHADFGWMIPIGRARPFRGDDRRSRWGSSSRYVNWTFLTTSRTASAKANALLRLQPWRDPAAAGAGWPENHRRALFVPVGSTAYEWFELIGDPFTGDPGGLPVAIYGLAVRQGMAKDR